MTTGWRPWPPAFPACEVAAVQLLPAAPRYGWDCEPGTGFAKHTLFGPGDRPSMLARLRRLVAARHRLGRGAWFLCHYEAPEVFLFALWLRLTLCRVYTMADAKFDDRPRRAWREALKTLALAPYHGAIGCGRRSADYLRFLGLRRVETEYDTLSIARIRRLAGAPPAPEGAPHAARHFIAVARHVPKKNLCLALRAFALHAPRARHPRRLVLCGDGPLTGELKAEAARLGIAGQVEFTGFLQSAAVARHLAAGLALLLPSTEEQFGLAIIEAQAMGLPVLASEACGARDRLLRNWQNGFVFEPDNAVALAEYMTLLDAEAALWARLCRGAAETAPLGDVARFTAAVARLTGQELPR